ncbi:MinD superfamily P-loop ATPase [Desulfitispora alkaliphila]|uniref:P-loop NTPase n=1 Tax=Desulfitispora alkaliphila TaxID=622674 RepID=UPI003D215C58
MNIAVLSGKGGTGKTTITTNLALLRRANYIDCDVEEPNGFIFLKPKEMKANRVKVEVPLIDQEKCKLCGICVKTCKFNALAKSKSKIITFEKLCHNCGACNIVCSTGALKYKERVIGNVEEGIKEDMMCKRGILNIGEPMAVPILRELLSALPKGFNLLDCPPGTSCNVVTTLKYADRAILVTEPTAFGLHDLRMAVELVKKLEIPFGLILNKYFYESNPALEAYVQQEGIRILGNIPYDRNAAKSYSEGKMLIDIPNYREAFSDIYKNIEEVLL